VSSETAVTPRESACAATETITVTTEALVAKTVSATATGRSITDTTEAETVPADEEVLPQTEPRVIVATIRVFHRQDYVYLSPYIVVDGDISIPHIRRGKYKAINGWRRYRQLRKQYPDVYHPNFPLIDRLAQLKEQLTSKQMLTHPEASDLLLELNERNRQSPRQTLLEFLINGELFRQEKVFKVLAYKR